MTDGKHSVLGCFHRCNFSSAKLCALSTCPIGHRALMEFSGAGMHPCQRQRDCQSTKCCPHLQGVHKRLAGKMQKLHQEKLRCYFLSCGRRWAPEPHKSPLPLVPEGCCRIGKGATQCKHQSCSITAFGSASLSILSCLPAARSVPASTQCSVSLAVASLDSMQRSSKWCCFFPLCAMICISE